ncbi:hypothetical protein [Haloferula sp. BvORR071]|uniref:hypothetical protein n=1 Tax=Haloferula sp. BvORR071 TaxID=1396141 RepID=UPI0005582BC0|nr:hypothetical protein [Haloferula sp. BvORR071]
MSSDDVEAMNIDPPPLPPGYVVEPAIETPPLPPGYGVPPEESRPNRRRRRLRVKLPVIFVFLVAAWLGLYYGPLSYIVYFADDRGMVPPEFVATLKSGDRQKLVIVERGQTRVMRFRWDEIEITDLSYLAETHPLKGDGKPIRVERNTSRKLKDAARGSHSIPQHGDPDPRND